eukprot:4864401-Pleurochrysis_carterae.AAC.1
MCVYVRLCACVRVLSAGQGGSRLHPDQRSSSRPLLPRRPRHAAAPRARARAALLLRAARLTLRLIQRACEGGGRNLHLGPRTQPDWRRCGLPVHGQAAAKRQVAERSAREARGPPQPALR